MLICGIDPGLANLGWALVDSRDARIRGAARVATHKGDEVGDMQARLADLLQALHGPVFRAELVVVEWPGMGGARVAGKMNATAASQVAAVAGAAIGLARGLGRPVLTPAPVTWRSALGCERGQDGALHARLARIYPTTAARFGKGALPHVLDAVGLALYGRLISINSNRSAA